MKITDGFKFGVGWVLAKWLMEAVDKAVRDTFVITKKG